MIAAGRYDLKVVPDAEPNADGRWIEAQLPGGVDPFKLAPLPGHHVVSYRACQDPQDGGPMHAAFLYRPPAPHRFHTSWVVG